MSTTTANLGLEKQTGSENASVVVLNNNLEKIDEFAGAIGDVGFLSTDDGVDPTTRQDGTPLVIGDIWFDASV